MFEDFTFDQKEVKPPTGPNLDSNLSPKDIPSDWFSPQAAPATLLAGPALGHDDSRRGSENIDTLTQQMSRQTLLPYVRSDGRRRVALPPGYTSSEIPEFDSGPVLSMPSLRTQPLLARTFCEDMGNTMSEKLAASPTRLSDSSTDLADLSYYRASCRSRRLLKTDAQSNVQNPRAIREALLDIMINHGVQCKVQSFSPPTPVSASLPTFPDVEARRVQSDLDQPMWDSGKPLEPLEPLEIDEEWCEKSEEALLKGMVHLRQAAIPSGIRRSNGPRYYSSADSALRSQNLKYNKIKIRKRDKQKPKQPTQMPTPPPEDAASPLSV